MPYTVKEFAARIKAKYPTYASVEDTELVTRIVDKYPTYRDSISFEVPAVHTMPSGETMPGPEHPGAVPGSERLAAEPWAQPRRVTGAEFIPEAASTTAPAIIPAALPEGFESVDVSRMFADVQTPDRPSLD
jgi:hypothetical protein